MPSFITYLAWPKFIWPVGVNPSHDLRLHPALNGWDKGAWCVFLSLVCKKPGYPPFFLKMCAREVHSIFKFFSPSPRRISQNSKIAPPPSATPICFCFLFRFVYSASRFEKKLLCLPGVFALNVAYFLYSSSLFLRCLRSRETWVHLKIFFFPHRSIELFPFRTKALPFRLSFFF